MKKPTTETSLSEARLLGKISSARSSIAEAISLSREVLGGDDHDAFLEWAGEAQMDLDEAVKFLPGKGVL